MTKNRRPLHRLPLELAGLRQKLPLRFGKNSAAPDFSGAYRDLESSSGSFSFSVCNALQGSFFYHKYRSNLEPQPRQIRRP